MSARELHNVSAQNLSEQRSTEKPSRIHEQIFAFIESAFASGAAESLNERRKLYIAHAATKPHLTNRELGQFVNVHTDQGAIKLWKRSIQELWEASPPEIQDRYPLVELLQRRRRAGIPFSPEARASMSEGGKGKHFSDEHRKHISEAHQKRWVPKERLQNVEEVILYPNSPQS